jgi:hypothetical protein
VTSENPLDPDNLRYPSDSPPYLPPQSSDPGIPGKWRRPSIRERGILIWILVLSILGLFSVNTGGSEDAYSGAYSAVQDAMYGGYYNNGWDADVDAYLTRTPVAALETEAGVVVYAIVTNTGIRAQALYDIVVENVPQGVTSKYITGPLSIVGGEARVLAVLLPEKEKLSDTELRDLAFIEAKTPEQTTVMLDNVMDVDLLAAKELAQAYEPIARAQLDTYLTLDKAEERADR